MDSFVAFILKILIWTFDFGPERNIYRDFRETVPRCSDRLWTVWRNQTCWISCTPDYRENAEELLGEWDKF